MSLSDIDSPVGDQLLNPNLNSRLVSVDPGGLVLSSKLNEAIDFMRRKKNQAFKYEYLQN